MRKVIASALAGSILSATPLYAQDDQIAPEAVESAAEIYVPADFARVSPRNALDLVQQIPGFSIEGNDGGRGFGQASGNVLFNGERISSKSTNTFDQLRRIGIGDVIRMEVVDGATLDIPGLSGRVVNLIVRKSDMSGQFEWRPQFSSGPSGLGWWEGEISLSGTRGPVEFTVALDSGSFLGGSDGPAIFTTPGGVDDVRFNINKAYNGSPRLSGAFRIDVAPEVVANFNIAGRRHFFRSSEREYRVSGNPLPRFDELFNNRNDEHSYEISGDIEFPIGPGKLKLIALESFRTGDFSSSSLLELEGQEDSGSRFGRESDIGERIGRAEYSWPMLGADFQLSGEAAFNRLDRVGSLAIFDPIADDYVEIAFPSGTGGVREERYEGQLSIGFPLSSNLTLQFVGGGEYSTISQTGANALSRTFKRPKGSLNLAWAVADDLDLSLSVQRTVGQLDFGDFLASVNLSGGNQSAGNNELRPQQNWNYTFEATKQFGDLGSATLRLFDEHIEDLVVFVPLENGAEARGNISDTRRYGLEFNGTLEMAALGFTGAKWDVTITAENSRLMDPVTLVDRRFDGNNPFEIRTEFRHDIPNSDYAWGFDGRYTQRFDSFRIAEVFRQHGPSKFGALFVEHKDVFGMRVKLRLANIFNSGTNLRRAVFDGPRDSSTLLFTEDRRRKIGAVFNVTVAGSF